MEIVIKIAGEKPEWAECEIVRCKDCKFFTIPNALECGVNIRLIDLPICNFWGNGCITETNGFCAWGELRENTTKD